MLPLDSIFVTDRILSPPFLMSFFVGGILTGLFSSIIRNSRIISSAVQKAVQGSLSNRRDSGKIAPSSPPRLQGRSGPSRPQFYSDSPRRGWVGYRPQSGSPFRV